MRGGDEESTRKRKRPEKKSPAARLQNFHVRRRELLLRFATFGNYPNLDLRGHLAVQFGGDAELSELLDRLLQHQLATIELEALLRERFRDVRAGHRAVQRVGLAHL